jgi:hypothetical protein
MNGDAVRATADISVTARRAAGVRDVARIPSRSRCSTDSTSPAGWSTGRRTSNRATSTAKNEPALIPNAHP